MATAQRFDVGGVLLERPFKIRRLGHFGINLSRMAEGLEFYRNMLGFRVTDIRDPFAGREMPDAFKGLGDPRGYFTRYGSDHHAFVINNHRVRLLRDRDGKTREGVTIGQITWQVQSLREVMDGHRWLAAEGCNMVRVGRDMPGSNWHTYLMDPDWHQNELYYGIEQVGWSGHSKPWDMHDREFREAPELPQISEYREVEDALARGVDLMSGYRDTEDWPATFDVDGILMPRPFKIVRIGPVGLFAEDVDAMAAFYTDKLGFVVSEESAFEDARCLFLRCSTEHHSLALYPMALREVLGFSEHSTLMSFGLQLANYRQLKAAVAFLEDKGVKVRELDAALFPGMGKTAIAFDPDGHAMVLYHEMEQVGWDGRVRPAAARRRLKPGEWPETIDGAGDSFMGEPFLGPWA
ncbi:MAG: VOC family protein [Alphaproteobacteria bacterium]|nr:VOC family protein [Alphaproteobacteria bacterium]